MYQFYPEIRLAALLAFFGYVLWLIMRRQRTGAEALRAHLEGRNRLIERFGDAESFVTFARSEDGRSLLQAPNLPSAGPRPAPGLRLLQTGLAGLPIGAGFLYLARQALSRANMTRANHVDLQAYSDGQGYEMIGVVLLCTAIGLLIAGLAARLAGRYEPSPRS